MNPWAAARHKSQVNESFALTADLRFYRRSDSVWGAVMSDVTEEASKPKENQRVGIQTSSFNCSKLSDC
jgi:hypothetical protein